MMIRLTHFANEYDVDDIGNTNNIEDYVNSALQWRGRLGMRVRSDILRPLCWVVCRFCFATSLSYFNIDPERLL